MEKSFDLGSLMKQHIKKHKSKPTQFESVAGGKLKRMESRLKERKSSRLTSFDQTRNLLPPSPVPVPVSEAKQKAESRRQQLQKWKEEKEKKKKESATKKLKPFIIGVPHNPLKYVPPPPARAIASSSGPVRAIPSTSGLTRAIPSSSGRVTRSQSAKNQKDNPKKGQSQSFAPNNAGFQAPQIKTLKKLPILKPFEKKKEEDILKLKFQPIIPAKTASITTRSQAYQRVVAESRAKAGKTELKSNSQITKPKRNSRVVQLSSSSENESLMQTSTSSRDIDLTARLVSSSEDSNFSENDSSKTTQSLSNCELVFRNKARINSAGNMCNSKENSKIYSSINSSESIQSSSSCEFVKEQQPIRKRKSIPSKSVKAVTPNKLSQQPSKEEIKLNTPQNPPPRSESSSEERLRSSKLLIAVQLTPEQLVEVFKKISPSVTLSRGKDNARREMKKKIEEGLFDEDTCDMDSVETFERQLASEINRITEICKVWDKIYEQVSLPEPVQGLVLGAVGQARLLMSQKMQQFAQLLQRCARPEPGATLVTPADLSGFWDMLFLQIENVDMRFKELEELKARNWVEKAAPVAAAGRKPRPKAAAPAPKPRAAPSRLRDMIAAARKAKAQASSQETAPAVEQPPAGEVPQVEERTFEAGFFTVRSPVRSPRTPATPRDKHTLLKAVLSTEVEKASASKKSASFAMLRASVLGKSVECDGVAPLPQTPVHQINLQATPGRSILKQPQESINKSNKQVKVVLFQQPNNGLDTSIDYLDLPKEEEFENAAENLAAKQLTFKTEGALTPMDVDENEKGKTRRNSRRSTRLTRQDAFNAETEPMTASTQEHRTEIQAEQEPAQSEPATERKTRKSTRKKVQKEVEGIETPQQEEKQQAEDKSQHSEKPRRSARKSVLTEVDAQTPRAEQIVQMEKKSHSEKQRKSSRKKVLVEVHVQTPETDQKINSEKKNSKRSTRNKNVAEVEQDALKENVTPMRSRRRRKTDAQAD